MSDFERKLSPEVRHVLCLFAGLNEKAQKAFSGALNEYLLASPARRRQLIKQWQGSVDATERRQYKILYKAPRPPTMS